MLLSPTPNAPGTGTSFSLSTGWRLTPCCDLGPPSVTTAMERHRVPGTPGRQKNPHGSHHGLPEQPLSIPLWRVPPPSEQPRCCTGLSFRRDSCWESPQPKHHPSEQRHFWKIPVPSPLSRPQPAGWSQPRPGIMERPTPPVRMDAGRRVERDGRAHATVGPAVC